MIIVLKPHAFTDICILIYNLQTLKFKKKKISFDVIFSNYEDDTYIEVIFQMMTSWI